VYLPGKQALSHPAGEKSACLLSAKHCTGRAAQLQRDAPSVAERCRLPVWQL